LSVRVTKLTECASCGAEIEPAATGRPRETCGDRCRQALWRKREAEVRKREAQWHRGEQRREEPGRRSIQDLRRAFFSGSAEEQRAKRDEIARRLRERDLELRRQRDRCLAESEVAA